MMNTTCIGLVNPSEIIGTHALGTVATGKMGWKQKKGVE